MAKNANLNTARKAKNDEFYTQLSDIENELKHYKSHFKGKVVYCNCDDSRESNFFKFFFLNFKDYGLKKLICTGYKSGGHGVKYVTEVGDLNNNAIDDDNELDVVEMEGDGSYESPECLELLKESDIVVTNPPFSLFRSYLNTLIEYGKKFLIIGNMNAIACKEIFPLIKENKLWFGPSISSGDRRFGVPDDYELNAATCGVDENGKKYINVKGVRWFTNLEHNKRHEPLTLENSYYPEVYPHYDNYDAIEVSKTRNIPKDYNGVMGVPISFLDKYCPEQFEIVGLGRYKIKGKTTYARILIRNKKPEKKIKSFKEFVKDRT